MDFPICWFCHRKQQDKNAFFLAAVTPDFGRHTNFRMFGVGNGCTLQRYLKSLLNVLFCGLVQRGFAFLASFHLSGLFFLPADISTPQNLYKSS